MVDFQKVHKYQNSKKKGKFFRKMKQILKKKLETCKKCYALRPPRTHHCSVCDACIERMDHHCPWMNTCVGLKNQKVFLLFLAYTCSVAVECLILTAVRLFTCPSLSKSVMIFGLRMIMGEAKVQSLLNSDTTEYLVYEATCDFTIDYVVSGSISVCLAIVFIFFIAFIASEQIQGILSNQTHVELLKRERGPVRTMRQAAIETFGMEPSLWWLIPIDWRWSSKPKSD